MTDRRERIAALIRALREKTTANGCTEGEAVSAAEKLAQLLTDNGMTLDEAEMRASPFERHSETHDDWVGERLWKIAKGISAMTGVRYWSNRPGYAPSVDFFGFAHEVDVARYLLEVCRGAMLREQRRIVDTQFGGFVATSTRQRRAILPFLDGMADRLCERLTAMKPVEPTGTGLVVLRGALIDAAMPFKTVSRDQRASRDFEPGYENGRAAGDRVALNQGLREADATLRIAR